MATKRDYYEILGVSKSTSADEIKKAYRKQALKWHPDKHQEDKKTAEAKFKEINQAYEVLSDSQKKSAYDQLGHAAFEGGAGGPFGQGSGRTYRQGPFTYTYTTSGGTPSEGFEGFSDPFEIFAQFFGGGSPFRRGPEIPSYSLTLSFMEAVKGCSKDVIIKGKKRKIKIPAGVDNGSRIRFQDFNLVISVQPHQDFKRDGQDLFLDFPIKFSQLVMGVVIRVPTIDKEVKLKIQPGTQPGTLIRLRGKGVPYTHRRSRGDQYVRIGVKIPQKLTARQKQLLQEFDQS
ncbi:DnaJ domain-containing protein [Candidatus Microgenomates bacterium]|nr:DnaJ domain-containing protein [Candidatus Microgenomates bacterium]